MFSYQTTTGESQTLPRGLREALWAKSLAISLAIATVFVVFGCISQELTDAGAQIVYDSDKIAEWSQKTFEQLEKATEPLAGIEDSISEIAVLDLEPQVKENRVNALLSQLVGVSQDLSRIDLSEPLKRAEKIAGLGEAVMRYGGAEPCQVDEDSYQRIKFALDRAVERITANRMALEAIKTSLVNIPGKAISAATGGGFPIEGGITAILTTILGVGYSIYQKKSKEKEREGKQQAQNFNSAQIKALEGVDEIVDDSLEIMALNDKDNRAKIDTVLAKSLKCSMRKAIHGAIKKEMTNRGIQPQFHSLVQNLT